MPNYANGKIYAIRVEGDERVYIGSTTKGLGTRLCNHRGNYNHYTEGRGGNYTSSFEFFSIGEPTIELLEDYPCETKAQLLAREDYYIRTTVGCINQCGAVKDPNYHKDWYDANIERLTALRKASVEQKAEYDALYRATHEQKRKEQARANYLVNREKRCAYAQAQREKKKTQN